MRKLIVFSAFLCLSSYAFGQPKLPQLIVSQGDTLAAVPVSDLVFIQTKAIPLVETIHSELTLCDKIRTELRNENEELREENRNLKEANQAQAKALEKGDEIGEKHTENADVLKKQINRQRWKTAGIVIGSIVGGGSAGYGIGKITP